MIPSVNFRNSFNLVSANVEINALRHIKDRGCRNDILCYVDHFIDFSRQTVCIITEKFPKEGSPAPTLASFMSTLGKNSLSFSQYVTIVKNILDAFAYLHSINVFHNDVKPTNILISPSDLAIHVIDFGSACMERYCISTKSEGYFHPKGKVLESGSYGRNASKNLDIYALAVVFEQLLKTVDLKTANSYPSPFLNILNYLRLMQNIDINDTSLTLQNVLEGLEDKPKKRLSKLFR
jgi:serine/threonine protein kinase